MTDHEDRSGGRFRDLRLTQKLTLLTALVGAVASLVACLSFVIFDLAAPEQIFSDRLERDLAIVALVFLSSSFCSLLVSQRFRRIIAEPLLLLARAVQQVTEEGRYSMRLAPAGEDEVGSLVVSFNGMLEAIQERERALRISEERYALVLRGANPGIFDWSLESGQVYYSSRWKEMLGHTEAEISQSLDEWLSRVHKDDLPVLKAALDAHLAQPGDTFQHEYRMIHRDGSELWVHNRAASLRTPQGKVYRIAGSQTDISLPKAAEQQLRHDAFHDALTGLPNRALFFDRLGRALERYRRHPDHLFAVLFLDLDGFKTINDSLGHLVGDRLLEEIARRLVSVVRTEDTVARLGGDEFTLLLEDLSDIADPIRVAERVHAVLKEPFPLAGNQFYPTASIGIALSAASYEQPEDLLRDADTAMYRAKTSGKANHKIFDLEMHQQAVSRLQLETGLRRALDQCEFVVHYQPVVSLKTGRIVSFEALVRWIHPDQGLVLPGEFIHIAEDSGSINAIGEFVLRQACLQLKQWRQAFGARYQDLLVSVNVSVRQFDQPQLVEKILGIIEDTGAPADGVRLEVTESALMRDVQTALAVLDRLKDLEIQFYLDDFGTGYSSLNHLRQFPFDVLKVDQTFVAEMNTNRETLKIVETVLKLADNLGMRSIAEGVETPEQLAQLQALGCELAQGFLFCKAVSADEATQLLEKDPRW